MQRPTVRAVTGLAISVAMQGTLAVAGTTVATPSAQPPIPLQDGRADFDTRQISISPAPAHGGARIVIDEETNQDPVVINKEINDRLLSEGEASSGGSPKAPLSIFHLFKSPRPRVNEEGKGNLVAQVLAGDVSDKVDRSKSADRVGEDRGDCAMTGDERGPSGCEILKQDVNHYEWPAFEGTQ